MDIGRAAMPVYFAIVLWTTVSQLNLTGCTGYKVVCLHKHTVIPIK